MIVRQLVREFGKHCYLLAADADYRTLCRLQSRLGKVSRRVKCETIIRGWKIACPDAPSFLWSFQELFVDRIYEFRATSSAPEILDIGANIGLSVLFFKTLYPAARVMAFEPDPKIFEYLKHNVHGNGFTDVQLINKAVWDKPARLPFCSDGADSGHVVAEPDRASREVEAVDIAGILRNGKFEFVKIDIEGSEHTVLPACRGMLGHTRYVFLEYHSERKQKQELGALLGLLANEGFRVDLQVLGDRRQPFLASTDGPGYDLQANIFARREELSEVPAAGAATQL